MGRSNSPELEAEMQKLVSERDSLAEEVCSLESNYSNLFKLYEKMRENCIQLKATEDAFRQEIAEQGRKYADLYALYSDLLNDAQQKLNAADSEMQRVVRENEEKTLGIRLTLKKAQVQNRTLTDALDSKVNDYVEVSKIQE